MAISGVKSKLIVIFKIDNIDEGWKVEVVLWKQSLAVFD